MSRNHVNIQARRWYSIRRAVFERDSYRCVLASRYVAAANRAALADSDTAKLGVETGTKLSNLSPRLDKRGS